MKPTYIPGVCNIGPEEIRTRRNVAIGAGALTLVAAGFMIYVGAPLWARLALFLPALVAVLNTLQVAFTFCVALGAQGLFSMGEVGKSESVEQAAFRAKDRKKVVLIWTYALVITALLMIGIAFL